MTSPEPTAAQGGVCPCCRRCPVCGHYAPPTAPPPPPSPLPSPLPLAPAPWSVPGTLTWPFEYPIVTYCTMPPTTEPSR